MKKMLAALVALCGALCACAAGFDGKNLVTNDWFDASFTSLAVDTTIATNTTSGITRGAGMWTEAPTNGTATIVADADAGGGATCLSLNAPGELLKFTPAPFSVTSGMETVVAEFKADAIDSLPDLPETAQGGFTVYMDANDVLSAKGWTSTGWTTLSSAPVDSLTNQWVTVYLDFATVNNVRYVRYSVKPATGSLSILTDEGGNSWFQARTNATTVSAVAFSGVATCRTFSGDSLAEAVATCNGVNYATVGDAIAAAEENGTVTLVKTAYNELISITKNVSIDLHSNPLNCDSFNIAEGTTLTVINTGNKQIKAPAFTGGGSIVATKGLRLCPTDATATSSLASITVTGDLSFDYGSTGTFNVTGDVTVSGTLTARDMAIAITGDLTAGAIAASGSTLPLGGGAADTTVTPQDTRLTVGGTITGSFVAGSGIVEYDGAMTINADSDGAFAGAILGGDVTKTGSGTLSLVGTNVIDGALNIEAGTVKLLNPYDIGTITFDFDASDENTFNTENDVFTSWDSSSSDGTKLILGDDSFTAPERALMEGAFGGTHYVVKSDKMRLKSSGSITVPLTTFIMWRTAGWNNSGTAIFGDSSNSSWSFNRRNTYSFYEWRNYNLRDSQYNAFSNGQSGTPYLTDTDQLLSICGRHWMRYTTGTPYFGPGVSSTVAYAEILGFAKAFTLEERKAMEAYLMNKWGVGNVGEYATLPATTEVALSNDAVLDLGGFTQTLKSVSGSGVISNGTLTVTDAISVGVGESLVIPYGSTYTLASDGTFAVEDSVDGTVTITHYAAAIDGTPYDSVREAILAYTSGTLTIYDSATDINLGTTDVDISGVVLASGVSAPTFAANLQYTASYSSGTISNVRDAKTYVWNGGVDTAWSTLGNWQIGDDEPLLVPAAGDTISFASAATVTAVPASTTVSAITMGSNIGTVTIAGEPLTISTAISVTAGNTLVIPYGSTYTLADGTGEMVDTTAGTVTLKHKAATITADDVTRVYDTVKGAILAYSSGTLTIYENATDIDLGTTDYTVGTVVLADDVDAPTFVANAPYVAKYENGAISNVRVASTYTWTPTGSSTDWNTLSNWRIGTATPVVAAGNSDTVVFPALEEETEAHKITVTSANVASVIINGDVEITGAIQYTRNSSSGNSIIYTTSVTGTGKATLGNNAGFGSSTKGSSLSIDVPLVVTASKDTPAAIQGYWKSKGGLADCSSATITGAITGTGYICFSGNRFSCSVTGSVADFEGTIEITGDSLERNSTTFADVSSKAKYNITNNSSDDNSFITNYAADLSFRELSGSPTSTKIHGDTTYTWEVGSGNTSFTLNGQYHKTGDANSYNDKLLDGGIVIKKVGTGIMDFGGTWIHGLEIAAGTVHLRSSSMLTQKTRNHTYVTPISFTGGILQVGYTTVNHDTEYEEDGETVKTEAYTEYVPFDPSANILNSTSQIVFDDQGTNCTWATALASSNKGGFVKKGAGTLTLTAAPLYAGETYLDGGELKIPTTWTGRVKTNVDGMSVRVRKSDDSNYRVYTLGPKVGPMVILF